MSQNFDRAIYDLDRPGPGSFNDARHALLDEIYRNGADPNRLVADVNNVESQRGRGHQFVQLVDDGRGHLDIAPANYGRPMPPPPYEGGPRPITPGEAVVGGVLGALGAAAIIGAIRHDDHRPPAYDWRSRR